MENTNKIHKYQVTPYPYKIPGFWRKLWIKIKYIFGEDTPEPPTFEIYINAEFEEGHLVQASEGTAIYVILKKL